MDGNKKITGIVFAGIIALALTACRVQSTDYVGLYVDNLISVTDTTDPGVTPLNVEETNRSHAIKTTADSINQQEVEKLLQAISDSVQLLRHQMTEFQKQLAVMPDTIFTVEKPQKFQVPDSLQTLVDYKQLVQLKNDSIALMRNQITELKNFAGLTADTLNLTEEFVRQFKADSIHTNYLTNQLIQEKNDSMAMMRNQMSEFKKAVDLKVDTVYITMETVKLIKGDSIQTDYLTNQLLRGKNDTISKLRNQVIELKKTNLLKADTVYITKEIVTQLKGGSLQTDYETTRMLQTKNDTILALSKELTELRNSGIIRMDTIYVAREPVKSSVAESQQMDYLNQQLLRSKDEQIQSLQNQMNAMQNAASRTPQQAYVPREQSQAQPFSSQQTDQLSLQMFQAQNDTIQLLRSQLRNLQPVKRDSVIIEKVAGESSSDSIRELHDTLLLLKTRVLSLEGQNQQGKDTTALVNRIEIDAPFKETTDTTLIVAYYERGGIKPLEEETVLKQIKDLSNTKNVMKITLSGYTDSSGSEKVNKEITTKRLNYLSEKINLWISKEEIFFQNFGDVFASDKMISDERRIEIRILTK